MAEITRSRADEYPRSLPISVAHEPGPPIDEEELHRSLSRAERRESTELARLRRNYTSASSRFHAPASSIATPKPTTLFGRFIYAVRQFWKHQVSVTVPHESCRDHLGTYRDQTSISLQAPQSFHLQNYLHAHRSRSYFPIELSGSIVRANLWMQSVICLLSQTTSFHQRHVFRSRINWFCWILVTVR